MVRDQIALVDAHVHIHECFELMPFLESALSNFRKAAESTCKYPTFTGILMLAETAVANCFQQLESFVTPGKTADAMLAGGWHVIRTDEACSLILRQAEARELILIAGSQIATVEKLEVLALGTEQQFTDGEPIQEVIEKVRVSGALPVLPWGFGKWTGRRGRIMSGLLETIDPSRTFLGDNGGRLRYLPAPKLIKVAQKRGVRILPGSDPLPFPSELSRAGSFGAVLRGSIDRSRPARGIKRLLCRNRVSIQPYGEMLGPLSFIKNQLAMQMRTFR